MSLEYRIGDVFDRMAEIPDGSIDLIVTSPPFLALRSYLPADHPDKAKEIGSEATPAEFIDTLLALSAEWGRVLAPHGSLCVELGVTYSGSSGDNWHKSTKVRHGLNGPDSAPAHFDWSVGWPLAKSLTGIPTLYTWSLAYGRNLLTGQPIVGPPWRIRNVIVWARPNPPVGALGDKFRPATSYITVACRGAKRYFDLDAVRLPSTGETHGYVGDKRALNLDGGRLNEYTADMAAAGAPPLDWHTDHHPEDGDWLWKMSTQPYAGSHYATFPMALPKRLIEAMCPLRVCTVCGRPSERIVGDPIYTQQGKIVEPNPIVGVRGASGGISVRGLGLTTGSSTGTTRSVDTLGWSECGCSECVNGCRAPFGVRCSVCNSDTKRDNWRTGIVLDPFAGSGTTLEAAQAVGRHAIGIDLDHRNADLAQQRVGMFLTVEGAT
jgi:hypothetical protein